uniref:Glycoprotein VI platelet n=1 Tax=Microcebus murinus TaxID=30608 RepID=A0A8C5XH43_MICMU
MSPSPSALFCLGALPKPTLQAVPSPLVPLEKPVTIRCHGPPGVDLYRLEKLRSGKYQDQAHLFIPAMRREHAGLYRCSYQNASRWSPPSDQLELVATGVYNKPSLSAQPSPAVSPGGDVTLQCQTPYGFDQFALYKEGDPEPYKNPEMWYRASFPIVTVTAAHSGTYRCYSFSSSNPYEWSAPSDPLELVVTGKGCADQTFPPRPLQVLKFHLFTRSLLWFPEASGNITSSPEESDSPIAPARQHYTKGNLVRLCLGAVILLLLAGLLAEDWHSRRRPPLHRVRALQRPLPPLPQTQRSHGCLDGGRPDARHQGLRS